MRAMRIRMETTLKHPVAADTLARFLTTLYLNPCVEVSTFEGDITVRWEEDR